MTESAPALAREAKEDLEAEIVRLLARLPGFDEATLAHFLKGLPAPVRRAISHLWRWQAHRGQREPDGPWRVWLIMAGRGFGKTRAGAEWVMARVREAGTVTSNCPLRIALVGPTLDDVARVMVEGASGLIAVARPGEVASWHKTRGVVTFASGARAFAYSGEKPSRLRGPEHDFAWCDEIATWARAEASWDNLRLGLRRGERPRAVVTTTPRPMALLKRIIGLELTELSGGKSRDNVHLPADFLSAVEASYAGTRLGRQELDGELLEDFEGALWWRALVEDSRQSGTLPRDFRRVVVGVDPPAGVDGDECGIVVCGVDDDGVGYVLADLSAGGLSPEGWARKVAAAAEAWGAHRVVAEANNGGRMVETVLRGASVGLPVRLVHASEGKSARAEPVAALFEAGRVKIAGTFPRLEDQMCGILIGGGYAGPGRSPDRADAMVWALTELMLGKASAEPRVRGFF